MTDQDIEDRLLKEVRQITAVLDSIKLELFQYKDLHALSLTGAVKYLVRHKHVLDEIKRKVSRANPQNAAQTLEELEKILAGVD